LLKILVTNDDGIQSEGISALARALEGVAEVWVVAPDRERRGRVPEYGGVFAPKGRQALALVILR
jgi:5'/3'-nucleotidase SurE